jgi:hypothetical protein
MRPPAGGKVDTVSDCSMQAEEHLIEAWQLCHKRAIRNKE